MSTLSTIGLLGGMDFMPLLTTGVLLFGATTITLGTSLLTTILFTTPIVGDTKTLITTRTGTIGDITLTDDVDGETAITIKMHTIDLSTAG